MKLKWNPNGSLLAVSGLQVAKTSQGEEKEVCVVQFYDPFGQHIRSLKIPGKRITSLTWEYTGLRVALAVDSFIYFANVRPDYKWCHFAKDVLVYAYTKPDRLEQCLCYWNTKTNERVMKYPMKLYLLTSTGDVCLMATKPEEQGGQYLLTITNAIGVAIETKYIDFEPTFGMITKSHVFVANGDLVLFWQYRNTVGSTRATALDGECIFLSISFIGNFLTKINFYFSPPQENRHQRPRLPHRRHLRHRHPSRRKQRHSPRTPKQRPQHRSNCLHHRL